MESSVEEDDPSSSTINDADDCYEVSPWSQNEHFLERLFRLGTNPNGVNLDLFKFIILNPQICRWIAPRAAAVRIPIIIQLER